jgi:Aldehyde:ferredoxin oxidoreductase
LFGRLIRVDLSSGRSTAEQVPEAEVKAFLGGRGLGLRLGWMTDFRRGHDPFSPEAPFILASGPLAGTGIPMSSRAVAVFVSPLTMRWSYSTVGGSIAVDMRYAGADVLLVTGRAPRPSYILVEDGRAEVRDASDLWGLGTFEAERRLKEVHGRESSVAVIGPAGENLVRFASINHETWRQFGRTGGGAVMGSKNLKAVVFVPGSFSVEAYDPEATWQLVNEMTERLREGAKSYRDNGTLGQLTLPRHWLLPLPLLEGGQAPGLGENIVVQGPEEPLLCALEGHLQALPSGLSQAPLLEEVRARLRAGVRDYYGLGGPHGRS